MSKLKTLTALSLSLISINAFAYTGHGFKVISEKVTQTSGFNGHTVSIDNTNSVTTDVKAFNQVGHRLQFITIQSQHLFSAYNATNSTQRYTYNFLLSCGTANYNFEKTIDLYSHGNFRDGSMNYGAVQKDQLAYYDIMAQTRVTGAENEFHESHAKLHVTP